MNLQVSYGTVKRDPTLLAKLSEHENWSSFAAQCEATQIDPRIEGIVQRLLEYPPFKASWERMQAFYGATPNICITEELVCSVNRRSLQIPVQIAGTNLSLAIEILSPPTITCTGMCFPAAATLNLVQAMFELDFATENPRAALSAQVNEVSLKTMGWALLNSRPDGLLDLAAAPEFSPTLSQTMGPGVKLHLHYTQGSKRVSRITSEPSLTLQCAALALPNDRVLEAVEQMCQGLEGSSRVDDYLQQALEIKTLAEAYVQRPN